jgi:glutamate carboxypeptidase
MVDMTLRERVLGYLEPRFPFYLELHRRMVAVNSFTANAGGVNALGELTAGIFADLGFSAEMVQSANPGFGKHVILTRPGRSGRQIALVSHLDTVFPPEEEQRNAFFWRQDGDRIYGPGTVDIKGGTVMIYMVLDALRQVAADVYDDMGWVILLDASEETMSEDFGRLSIDRLGGNTLAYLVFEPGNTPDYRDFSLVVARKGMIVYRITAEGRAAHAGANHKDGANAIVQLAQTIQSVAGLTDYSRDLTFNVGTVTGGTVTNRVPHHAVADVEMRAFSPEVFDDGLRRMLALDGQSEVASANGGYPARIAVEVLRRTEPWPRNEQTLRLLGLWQTAAAELGFHVKAEDRGGLSDGNLTWQAIPTLDGLGPAGANAHCSECSPDGSKDQEYVLLPSFLPKALLNVAAILKLAQV